jgi:hypothetical protein
MRTVVRAVFGVVAGACLLLTITPTGNAQQQASVSLKPSNGPAGSSFTIGWSGFTACRTVAFLWADSTVLATGAGQSGSVAATVPAGAKPGSYLVVGRCQQQVGRDTFTVTATATTTPPPASTKPPVTPTTPATTKPATPTRPTTTPPKTTTTPSTPTTTPTTPPPSSSPTPTAESDVPETEPPSDGALTLDRPSINPGDVLYASGAGCQPGHTVTMTANGETVGTSTVDSTGHFSSPVEFTRIEPGRHFVTASCGIVLTGAVDQVLTSSTGGHSGTLVILVFFILVGIALIRFA